VLAVQHGKSIVFICLVTGRFVFPSSSLRKGCAKLGKGRAKLGKGRAKLAKGCATVDNGAQGYADVEMIVPRHRLQWFPDY
jgi:hypothetical protein